jgi:hypothetical protein
MEYVVTTEQTFEGVESRMIDALQQQGMVVHRTFSLRSAVGASKSDDTVVTVSHGGAGPDTGPGYSVLMLYLSDARNYLLGLVILYQQHRRTIIRFIPALPAEDSTDLDTASAPAARPLADVDAELVTALALSGLDFCVGVDDD